MVMALGGAGANTELLLLEVEDDEAVCGLGRLWAAPDKRKGERIGF
jgi:hypothetical protein